jgi:FkbM family methyltransferase
VRALINILLQLYLLPLSFSTRLARYVKGKILEYDNHYSSTLDVIRRYFPNDNYPVVDIGAYDGDSTVYFAKRLPAKKIKGFEPNPEPFNRAKLNALKFPNIEMFNIGFAGSTGEMPLFVTNDLVSSSLLKVRESNEFQFQKSLSVKVYTLDDFFKDYEGILLIKLDVQGAELEILKSGAQTIRKTKLILTEVLNAGLYEGGCQYYEIDQYLRACGFKMHSIFADYNYAGTRYFDTLYINERYASF